MRSCRGRFAPWAVKSGRSVALAGFLERRLIRSHSGTGREAAQKKGQAPKEKTERACPIRVYLLPLGNSRSKSKLLKINNK